MANFKFYTPFLYATALLITSMVCSAATADETKADVTVFGDWRTVCREQCVIAQGLQNPENPSITYSSQIAYVNGRKEPVMQLNLPLGVYLPPGVAIDIGENEHRAPVTVCLPQGCKVLLALTPEIIKQLQDNAAYTVKIFVTEQSPRQLKFSLRGFSDALASLKAGKN